MQDYVHDNLDLKQVVDDERNEIMAMATSDKSSFLMMRTKQCTTVTVICLENWQ